MTPAEPPPTNYRRIIGVYWDKRLSQWRAQVSLRGATYNLGTFLTQEEAAASRARFLSHFGYYRRRRPKRDP